MPIYEYVAEDADSGCPECGHGFEVLQKVGESPVETCPRCRARVKRVLSLCRANVVENSEASVRVESRISGYEKEGKWSHAAELADKFSEKSKNSSMKTRALENYKKAGYNTDSMESKD